MLPNVIIAGTNKSGTTSVFRYLSEHPDVCPSKIKEVRYFTRTPVADLPPAERYYAEQFRAYAGQAVRLEASPDYLLHGKDVAATMASVVPDAKLIFILREPLSRLVSAYNRRKTRQHDSLRDLSLQDYLELVLSPDATAAAALPIDLQYVDYAARLAEYLEFFPREQVAVRFFEQLSDDSAIFVKDICDFVSIDPVFFDTYDFQIQNRTRSVKSRMLHRYAHLANMRIEPLFNRYPALREVVRKTYGLLNYGGSITSASQPESSRVVTERVMADTASLRKLLDREFAAQTPPDWVAAAASRQSDQVGS